MKHILNQIASACGLIWLTVIFVATGCSKKSDPAANTPEATLAELNRAYAQWEMISVGPPPKTVEGLTKSYLMKGKRLPTVPPGKKLALDPSQRQVVIVDQ